MGANGLKVKLQVQLQFWNWALNDPSRGIRLFSSETIGHFSKKYFLNIYFLNKNAYLALGQPHALRNQVGKFVHNVGGRRAKTVKNALFQKSNNVGWLWSWRRKLGGVFHPTLPVLTKYADEETNCVWPFQRDNIMHSFMCIAELVQGFTYG